MKDEDKITITVELKIKPIYKLFTGEYIDLEKICSISKVYIELNDDILSTGFKIDYQLRETSVKYKRLPENNEIKTTNRGYGDYYQYAMTDGSPKDKGDIIDMFKSLNPKQDEFDEAMMKIELYKNTVTQVNELIRTWQLYKSQNNK